MVSRISILLPPLPTLFIPKGQPGLLSQNAIHGTAIKTFTPILPGSDHIVLCNLKTWKFDAMVLGNSSCVLRILD